MDTQPTTNTTPAPAPRHALAGLAETLASNYLLVELNLSRWQATATDRKQSAAACDAAGADRRAARLIKHLLVNADGPLSRLNSALDALRANLYDNTAPWSTGDGQQLRGKRLLKATKAPAFFAAHERGEREARRLLDEFLADYPAAVARALSALGGMGQASDYPTAEQLRARYAIALRVDTITSAASLPPNLPRELAERFADQLAAETAGRLQVAQAEVMTRAAEHCERLVTQLAKVDADQSTPREGRNPRSGPRLHDTLISSGRALADLLRDTAAGDPRLIELADRMARAVDAPSVSTWRDSTPARRAALETASTVRDTLRALAPTVAPEAQAASVVPVPAATLAALPAGVVIPEPDFF